MPDAVSSLRPGDRCGDYELLAFIGRGGMAQVWSARDVHTREVVALKTLLPLYAGNAILQERLMREGQSQQVLQHPNILRALNTFPWNGTNYIVMDLVDGESLEGYMQRRRLLPVPEVRGIAQAVLSALSHAHANNIVHRDVKPSNILLSRQGRILLSDFGIALLQNAIRLTRAGSMGTPSYMSPEQIVGRDINHLSDIYSVGCVLYELLTGFPPFHDESPQSNEVVRNAHQFVAPMPLRPRCPEIPQALENAILRALEKKPRERFQSCAEFAAALGLTIQFRNEEFAGKPLTDVVTHHGLPGRAMPVRSGMAVGGTPVSWPEGARTPGQPRVSGGSRPAGMTPSRQSAGPRSPAASPATTDRNTSAADLKLHRQLALTGSVAIALAVLLSLLALWISRRSPAAPAGSRLVGSQTSGGNAPPSSGTEQKEAAKPSSASAPSPGGDTPNEPLQRVEQLAAENPTLPEQVHQAYDHIQGELPASTTRGQRPAPLAPPPGAAERTSGVLQWAGSKGDRIEISGLTASAGTITGDPLPGVPVQISIEADKGGLVQAPTDADGFMRFIFRAPGGRTKIFWKTIGTGQNK
jgi:serine/threonine protein kinase